MLAEQVTKMKMNADTTQRSIFFNKRGKFSALAATVAALILAGCANQSGTRAPVNDLNSSSTTTAVVAKTYTVKPGDTLNKISRSTGVDENTIKRLNKLSDPKKYMQA